MFYRQVSAGELREKAEKQKNKLSNASTELEPIEIEGRKIANTWWGAAWCENLEHYADYRNRIGRGKSYVRAGAVIDLKLEGGTIKAHVQGSRKSPYKIEVKIEPMQEAQYRAAVKCLGKRIENLEALVNGDFPTDMKSLFTDPKSGIFPNPREIHFICTCPDLANMCKHVAAVLYGIGNRLDQNPLLFFDMRGIDVSDFIKRSVEEKLGNMLKHADTKSPRIIEDQSLEALFGVVSTE